MSQPFITNTPPALSAAWFGDEERAMATSVAVGFNELGVSVAYVAASQSISHNNDIPRFLMVVSLIATALTILVAVLFESAPHKAPSASAEMKRKMGNTGQEGQEFTYDGIQKLLSCPGFMHTLLGFTVAESVLNVYSTFLSSMLHQFGYNKDMIGWLGTSFFIAVMLGGTIFGVLVGRKYKQFILFLSLFSMASIAFFQISSVPDNSANVVTAVILIGFFIGPTQPLYAELGVEVAFPASENLIFALQQIVASLFSSVFVMFLQTFEDPSTYAIDVVNWAMLGWVALGTAVFLTFSAGLKRPRQTIKAGPWSIEVVAHIQAYNILANQQVEVL
jgi:hypothetical protein